MATLVTRDFKRKVELDEELSLVVAPKYTAVSVKKKGAKFGVEYWDAEDSRRRGKTFAAKSDAVAFAGTKTRYDGITHVYAQILMKNIEFYSTYYRLSAPSPTHYEAQEIPLPGQMMGIWLGDGCSASPKISTADKEILDYLHVVAKSFGMIVKCVGKYDYLITRDMTTSGAPVSSLERITNMLNEHDKGTSVGMICKKLGTTSAFVSKYVALRNNGTLQKYLDDCAPNPITAALKNMKVRNNKHIPDCYMHNSVEVRMQVLGGLIDTDGHLCGGGYLFRFKSAQLMDDVITLVRSLGFRCTEKEAYDAVCTNASGGPKICPAFRMRIYGCDRMSQIPILLPRKIRKSATRVRHDQLKFTII